MGIREQAIEEIQRAPEDVVVEALDFLRFLTARARADRLETAIASEAVLRRDWDDTEEDEAWKSL